MVRTRTIRRVSKSTSVIEGAGVHLKRAFGFSEVPYFDPFLLLDDFRSDNPDHYTNGFPWHPHRGIETITYVLRGDVEHGDSMGNKGLITCGDVQWMTAGSGIIHQEMPKGDARGRMEGFQLWANLPGARKMMPPRYRDVKAADIPEVVLDNGVSIKVICGRVNDTEGPVRDIVIDPEYLDISIPPNTTFIHSTKADHTVLAYVINGSGYFCPEKNLIPLEAPMGNSFDVHETAVLGNETLILFESGEQVVVQTRDNSLRFLLISGRPLGEPVAWSGPIVMNTREELRIAFREYEQGTFIKIAE